jgi:hypothetical protein
MPRRWPWALALLVLSPVCAEYLWGYDTSTGRPLELLGGLLIFIPLYGAPALLIRETARRLGLGWPAIVLLAVAAGIIEAGIVDQSMFSLSYRDIDFWDDITQPTLIEPLGISAFTTLTFVGGHVVLSFCAPIALVETIAGGRGERPWLGRVGLAVTGFFYLAACALVLGDHLSTEDDHASAAQVALAAAAALLSVGLAVATRPPGPGGDRPAPLPWVVLAVAFAAGSTYILLPPSPVGTATLAVVAAAVAWATAHLARTTRWGRAQHAALAGGALAAFAIGAFVTDPLGDVAEAAKYAHNVAGLALVSVLTVVAVRRVESETRS